MIRSFASKYFNLSMKSFFKAQENMLVTGSQDKTVRLWDITAGKLTNTLQGHTNTVRCLHFDQDKIISGSDDGTCKIYNLVAGEVSVNAHIGESFQ